MHKTDYKYIYDYNFKLENEMIYWKSASFPISTIKHLIYNRVLTKHSVNLIPAGESRSAELRIILDGGQNIKLSIKEGRPILFVIKASMSEDLKNMDDLYFYLSKNTFEKRLSSYIRQIKNQGFFEYQGDKYYPNIKVQHRRTEFFIENTRFYFKPGYLGMKLKSSGLSSWLKSVFTAIEIPTEIDTDVFFVLLEQYMGLKWNN